LGYTSSSFESLPGEPEAVSEEEQLLLTRRAHRAWELEAQREWGKARTQILDGVERFRRNGRADRQTISNLRSIERQVERVDQRLGLG
jgi:hypothetical protein